MILLEGVIFLVTSFSISILKNPEEKDLVSTELKQYVDASSKPQSSFNSHFASISSLQGKIEDLVTIRTGLSIFIHGPFKLYLFNWNY